MNSITNPSLEVALIRGLISATHCRRAGIGPTVCGMAIDWAEVHRTRREIDLLEKKLADRYARRRDIMAAMAAEKIAQRAIGAYWGISNPAVSYALRGGKASIRAARGNARADGRVSQ